MNYLTFPLSLLLLLLLLLLDDWLNRWHHEICSWKEIWFPMWHVEFWNDLVWDCDEEASIAFSELEDDSCSSCFGWWVFSLFSNDFISNWWMHSKLKSWLECQHEWDLLFLLSHSNQIIQEWKANQSQNTTQISSKMMMMMMMMMRILSLVMHWIELMMKHC